MDEILREYCELAGTTLKSEKEKFWYIKDTSNLAALVLDDLKKSVSAEDYDRFSDELHNPEMPWFYTELNDFLYKCKNIIHGRGINWFTLYCVTEEQKPTLDFILSRHGMRHDVRRTLGIEEHFSSTVQLRAWYKNPDLLPGRVEKEKYINRLEELISSENPEFTGISPEAYPELLERLKAAPDKDDIDGYTYHIHR